MLYNIIINKNHLNFIDKCRNINKKYLPKFKYFYKYSNTNSKSSVSLTPKVIYSPSDMPLPLKSNVKTAIPIFPIIFTTSVASNLLPLFVCKYMQTGTYE